MPTFCSEDSARGALALQKSNNRFIRSNEPFMDNSYLRPIVGNYNQLLDNQEHGRPHNLKSSGHSWHSPQWRHY